MKKNVKELFEKFKCPKRSVNCLRENDYNTTRQQELNKFIYETFKTVAKIEESSSEGSKYIHKPSRYGYFYLDHIAKVVALLNVEPYVLSTHPNSSEVVIVVDSMFNPKEYCEDSYGTS